jgi:hypothetical protein
MPSDPARKASDGPALTEAEPAFTDRSRTPADKVAEPGRDPHRPGAAHGDSARRPSSPGSAGGTGPPRSSAGVLANRLAAALVHHEPGWRLPRHTTLARRYNVSTAQIDAALGELAARRLVRRLPDGQLYRASPAEYLIPLAGTPRLAAHIDPMGGQIACRSRQVSWRRVPEDIGWALGVAPGDSACVVRLLWTSDGEPAALATTYLARHLAGKPASQGDESLTVPPAVLAALPLLAAPGMDEGPAGFLLPGAAGRTAASGAPGADAEPAGSGMPGAGEGAGPDQSGVPRQGGGAAVPGAVPGADAGPARSGVPREGAGAAPGGVPGADADADAGEPDTTAYLPRALFVELQPPPPALARSLRLSAGQPAAMITVRFDEPAGGRAAALTVAVLRPDMFRIVVESPDSPSPDSPSPDRTAGSFSAAWTSALQDWEP